MYTLNVHQISLVYSIFMKFMKIIKKNCFKSCGKIIFLLDYELKVVLRFGVTEKKCNCTKPSNVATWLRICPHHNRSCICVHLYKYVDNLYNNIVFPRVKTRLIVIHTCIISAYALYLCIRTMCIVGIRAIGVGFTMASALHDIIICILTVYAITCVPCI